MMSSGSKGSASLSWFHDQAALLQRPSRMVATEEKEMPVADAAAANAALDLQRRLDGPTPGLRN